MKYNWVGDLRWPFEADLFLAFDLHRLAFVDDDFNRAEPDAGDRIDDLRRDSRRQELARSFQVSRIP